MNHSFVDFYIYIYGCAFGIMSIMNLEHNELIIEKNFENEKRHSFFIIHKMIFSIFILILICVDCQLLHHDLVLVVGDISFSSVRILVDFAAPLEHQQNERVFVKVIDPTKQSILQTLTLADELTSDSPYLLVLKNLPQKTNLKVSFQIQSKSTNMFCFVFYFGCLFVCSNKQM